MVTKLKIYEIGTGYTPIPAQMGAATEIVVEELVKAFQKRNVEVELLDIRTDKRKENNLPIIEVPVPKCFSGTDVKLGLKHKLKRVVYSVALADELRKILKNANDQVILHFHNQYNLFFFLKLVSTRLRSKAKIAYTVHSYIWHGDWDEISEVIRKRYFQEVYGMQRADRVFVLNQKTYDNIAAYVNVDSDKLTIINNGVNTQVYRPMSGENKKTLLKKYGLTGKKVFIQVGSVCERKGQLEALRLLLPLLREDKQIAFCYAGGIISREYFDDINLFAQQNGVDKQVYYWGELEPGEKLNEFYNLAEAMVFPSRAEGFSLVILEAMAAGVPVLINEQLQFPLADKCLRYLDDTGFYELVRGKVLNEITRQELSKTVRQEVELAYSWGEVAKSYLQTFED